MEVESSKVHDPVYHKGQVNSNIERGEGSNLVAPTDCQFFSFSYEPNRPSNTDNLLWLTKRNTSHKQPSLWREDETHWGAVSSHLGANNQKEALSPEDPHRGEHRRLPGEATPRTTLRSSKDNDGTMTCDRAGQSRTRSKRQVKHHRTTSRNPNIEIGTAKRNLKK